MYLEEYYEMNYNNLLHLLRIMHDGSGSLSYEGLGILYEDGVYLLNQDDIYDARERVIDLVLVFTSDLFPVLCIPLFIYNRGIDEVSKLASEIDGVDSDVKIYINNHNIEYGFN